MSLGTSKGNDFKFIWYGASSCLHFYIENIFKENFFNMLSIYQRVISLVASACNPKLKNTRKRDRTRNTYL